MILKITKWYCRLGNNIIQVKNALHIAIFYGYNIIMPKHDFFNTTKIIINSNISDQSNVYIDPIASDFFFKDKITDFPQNIFDQNIEQVEEFLMNIFIIKYEKLNKLGDNDVLIHIRSGDLFEKKKPHGGYIVPPLCYYTDILTNNNYDNIYLIAEDTANPCINELIKLFPKIIFTINNLETDIKLIMSAKNIICSFGTFVPSLLFMTKHTKNVFIVSYYQSKYCDLKYKKGLNLQLCNYDEYYSLISKWKNTKEQNDLLIKYKKITSTIDF